MHMCVSVLVQHMCTCTCERVHLRSAADLPSRSLDEDPLDLVHVRARRLRHAINTPRSILNSTTRADGRARDGRDGRGPCPPPAPGLSSHRVRPPRINHHASAPRPRHPSCSSARRDRSDCRRTASAVKLAGLTYGTHAVTPVPPRASCSRRARHRSISASTLPHPVRVGCRCTALEARTYAAARARASGVARGKS